MTRLPLVSSREVCRAFERMGFRARGAAKGSHQVYVREKDGINYIAVIPLAKKEIARGTLKSLLLTGRVSDDEFLANL